jgi:hypothetical protein
MQEFEKNVKKEKNTVEIKRATATLLHGYGAVTPKQKP